MRSKATIKTIGNLAANCHVEPICPNNRLAPRLALAARWLRAGVDREDIGETDSSDFLSGGAATLSEELGSVLLRSQRLVVLRASHGTYGNDATNAP